LQASGPRPNIAVERVGVPHLAQWDGQGRPAGGELPAVALRGTRLLPVRSAPRTPKNEMAGTFA